MTYKHAPPVIAGGASAGYPTLFAVVSSSRQVRGVPRWW
jgi:hypothetical protein